MHDELYENPHRFAVMLRDWLTKQGKTNVDEITWHDILLTAGLAHFELVPTSSYLVKAPGPDYWDPSEGKSDDELLAEMLRGQGAAEEGYIDGVASGLHRAMGRPMPPPMSDPRRMQETVEYLASEELAGRAPGTPGGLMARDFVRNAFEEYGLTPAGEDGFDQSIPGNGGSNLLGLLPGSGPRSDRYILLAAHYDHLGEFGGEMYPGANDNGAAVAVMLDVAQRWRSHESDLDRSLLFCAFDAEEPPYFLTEQMGSVHFVEHPTIPLDQIDVMVCMDLVGTPLGPEGLPDEVRQSIFVLGGESAEGLGTIAQKPAMRSTWGITPRRLDSYAVPPLSDYYAFQQAGIPHLFLSGGRNEHYHQPSDTAEKVDYRRLEALSTYVTDLVGDLSLTHGTLAPIPGGADDRATVETLVSMAQLLSDAIPEAGQALTLLDEMRKKIEGGEALDSSDRGTIQGLIGLLEHALA
jgi:hypothetical protein